MVGVLDGDTIDILGGNNQLTQIRLTQIDAPEKAQDFGQAPKKVLSDLVYGKTVEIEIDTIDEYVRTVRKVIADGMDSNLELVKQGMAWVYRKYVHEQTYFAVEDAGKAERAGYGHSQTPYRSVITAISVVSYSHRSRWPRRLALCLELDNAGNSGSASRLPTVQWRCTTSRTADWISWIRTGSGCLVTVCVSKHTVNVERS